MAFLIARISARRITRKSWNGTGSKSFPNLSTRKTSSRRLRSNPNAQPPVTDRHVTKVSTHRSACEWLNRASDSSEESSPRSTISRYLRLEQFGVPSWRPVIFWIGRQGIFMGNLRCKLRRA